MKHPLLLAGEGARATRKPTSLGTGSGGCRHVVLAETIAGKT
jgi:hypothetical protein